MSNPTQYRVHVFFHDNTDRDFRYAQNVGMTEFGVLEIVQPRDIRGKVMIPLMTPASFVKYVIVEDEVIAQVRAKIITP